MTARERLHDAEARLDAAELELERVGAGHDRACRDLGGRVDRVTLAALHAAIVEVGAASAAKIAAREALAAEVRLGFARFLAGRAP